MLKLIKSVYTIKKLIPGSEIEPGLAGWYAAVPEKGYKGHPFKILYNYQTQDNGEVKYHEIELEIKDWLKAEKFRRFPDQWGRGTYTLGYFKLADSI